MLKLSRGVHLVVQRLGQYLKVSHFVTEHPPCYRHVLRVVVALEWDFCFLPFHLFIFKVLLRKKKYLKFVASMWQILRLWQFTGAQKPLCDKCCWCTPNDTLNSAAWRKSVLLIITAFIIVCINFSAVLFHIWTETKRGTVLFDVC